MDNKFDKKKESIDEILSDLNGLLNKMPSILDGIKMPEMQPQDYAKPAQAPEPQTPKPEAAKEVPSEPVTPEIKPAPAEPFDAEKTVVLESFAGLPEGSQVPGEISFSQEPEPARAPPRPSLNPACPPKVTAAPPPLNLKSWPCRASEISCSGRKRKSPPPRNPRSFRAPRSNLPPRNRSGMSPTAL